MITKLQTVGNGPADKVRYKGVLHEIQLVRAHGTRLYLNLETGERFQLSKSEQAAAVDAGDLFTELEWREIDEADVTYRLAKDHQLEPSRNQDYAVFKAQFSQKLDDGHYSPKKRRSKKVLIEVIEAVMKADKSGFAAPHYRTVREKWDPLWLRAKNIKVMLPNYELRGRHGPDPEFAELDRLTREILDKKIAEDGGIISISALQDYVNAKLYLLAEKSGLKFRPRTQPGQAIGVNRVRSLLRERNFIEHQHEKLSRKEARRQAEGITIGPTGDYPLHEVEIDHSPMDILVKRPGLKDARPYITILIDRYSRYIIGFYISFDAPSWYSVAMALRLAVVPKDAYLRTLKYDFVHPWLAYGSPDFLIMDRAQEFQSTALAWAASDLRMSLVDMPAASGSDKGKIERSIGTLQRELCKRLPGYTGPNITKRDPELAVAKLFLHELEVEVAAFIVDRYHLRVHGTTGRRPQDMYAEHLERGLNVKLPPSPEILGSIATKLYPCVVTNRGVSVDGEQYRSDELIDLFNANGGNMTTVARPDPLDADVILIRHSKGWCPGYLTGNYAARGMTRDQLQERRAIDRMPRETKEDIQKRHVATVQFEDSITTLRQRASRKPPRSNGRPKKATTYINRPTFDANSSHDGFEGYDPNNRVAVDRYTSSGPYAERSMAARTLDDLPGSGSVDQKDALQALGLAESSGHEVPRSTPEETALRPSADHRPEKAMDADADRSANDGRTLTEPAKTSPTRSSSAKSTTPRSFLL